jgi:hypothetical protein
MDLNFNKNEDHNKLFLCDKKIKHRQLGGGENAFKKLHNEGKMTA